MKRWIPAILLSVATSAFAAAQLYRWVDDKGNVEYRDTPPPPNAKKVEERRVVPSTIETSAPSYTMQQAMKNHPVTLWAFDCGDGCTSARAHLARRGVPYTEKDPRPDLKGFEKLTGGNGVPVLFVGSTKLLGYLESEWDSTLDSAGYPRNASATASKPTPKPAAQRPETSPEQAAAPTASTQGQAQAIPPTLVRAGKK